MYLNINLVDKKMQSVIENYRFQLTQSSIGNASDLNIKEKVAFEMLVDQKHRPDSKYQILHKAAGEMLENRIRYKVA